MNPLVLKIVHDLSKAMLDVLVPLIAAGGVYVVKLGISHIRNGIVQALARRAVRYAAQKVAGNSDRLAYVTTVLSEKCKWLTKDEIAHYIEQAVVDLKAGLEKQP